jgi:hypothetical protein
VDGPPAGPVDWRSLPETAAAAMRQGLSEIGDERPRWELKDLCLTNPPGPRWSDKSIQQGDQLTIVWIIIVIILILLAIGLARRVL